MTPRVKRFLDQHDCTFLEKTIKNPPVSHTPHQLANSPDSRSTVGPSRNTSGEKKRVYHPTLFPPPKKRKRPGFSVHHPIPCGIEWNPSHTTQKEHQSRPRECERLSAVPRRFLLPVSGWNPDVLEFIGQLLDAFQELLSLLLRIGLPRRRSRVARCGRSWPVVSKRRVPKSAVGVPNRRGDGVTVS